MRGLDGQTGSMFSYVDLEERIPASHPLRKIRKFVNAAVAALDVEFTKLYSTDGRPSIAPERLLRAALIQILFSIRSERQLMEQMEYNLLFRWFVGLGIDDPVWVPTVFTKNRDRLLKQPARAKLSFYYCILPSVTTAGIDHVFGDLQLLNELFVAFSLSNHRTRRNRLWPARASPRSKITA